MSCPYCGRLHSSYGPSGYKCDAQLFAEKDAEIERLTADLATARAKVESIHTSMQINARIADEQIAALKADADRREEAAFRSGMQISGEIRCNCGICKDREWNTYWENRLSKENKQ